MNSVILIGRLTRDPELKYGQSGNAYARFSLAVTRPMKRDETDFINCVAFGKTAETIGQYLRKGSQIGVEGRLQQNKYQSQNGETRYSYDVVVNTFDFCSSNNSGGQSNYQNNNSNTNNHNNAPTSKNSEPKFYAEQEPEFKPKSPSEVVEVTEAVDEEFPF